jgi:hypothetical protein
LFTYFIENPLVIISINSVLGWVMVIRLDIEIWEIDKGGTKRGGRKRGGWVGGGRDMGFVALVCVSVVVVEGACVRDCRGLRLCIVGTVV